LLFILWYTSDTEVLVGLADIFDIRALWRLGLSVRVPGCQKLQMKA